MISQRGAPTPKGAPTNYLAKFHRKLYENEENLTERRVRIQNFNMQVRHSNEPSNKVHEH